MHRALATAAALAALGGLGIATAGTADAAGKNGVVEVGELGLYYLTDYRSPIFDLYVSDADFSNDVFPGTSISANNNTESFWNRDSFTWYVCLNANYGGGCGYINAGQYANFSATFKNTVTSAYYA
ncbi:peptidase inhibitor family I36 protein [Streptomyces sp. NPDC002055]|uniref:peptidase inhibitor family I36 protein n=1 Tax=Streptomyces sp. NPDC002055 TaxID=3154534 RepID=UPI003319BD52